MTNSSQNSDAAFRFVHFKIKNIESNFFEESDNPKTLLQIIDVCNKMLYNEIKAE